MRFGDILTALRRQPLPVEVEPNSAIAAARHYGEISAGRVGNTVNSSGNPVVRTETVLGFDYILDVEPNLSGSRLINLTAKDDKSAALTLMTSYDATTPTETSAADTGPGFSSKQPPERSHALLVQFGSGNARHAFEIDVAEGSTANIPGSQVEVTLLDYTTDRVTGLNRNFSTEEARVFVSHGNVSSGAHPFSARVTTRVYCPFQLAVDAGDPPLFDEFLEDLLRANMDRDIVTVVP